MCRRKNSRSFPYASVMVMPIVSLGQLECASGLRLCVPIVSSDVPDFVTRRKKKAWPLVLSNRRTQDLADKLTALSTRPDN